MGNIKDKIKDFSKTSFDVAKDLGKAGYKDLKDGLNKMKSFSIKNSSIMLTFLSQKELLSWSSKFIDAVNNATPYDDIVDSNYVEALKNNTASQMAGWKHRLFDDSHTLWGLSDKVNNLTDEDSMIEEIIAKTSVWFKDVTTPGGMPFFNVDDKASYDKSAQWVADNIPGANKNWFYDLHMYDIFELFSTTLGIVGSVFFLKKDDYEKLSELLGSMSILSILAANPLLGISVIVVTTYTYYTKKKKLNVKSISKGIAKSSISWIIFSILGIQLLIQIIILVVLYKLIKKTSISGQTIYLYIKDLWNEYILKNKKDNQTKYLLN